MAKLLLALTTLVCGILLTSCSLINAFGGRDPDVAAAEDRMEQIAAAVESGDAAALKAMFSARAAQRAADLDAGITYFLSLFSDAALTWRLVGVSAEGEVDHGSKTWMVKPTYKVSAGGNEYTVVFADLTVNDLIDPENVGLYALGAAAWTEPGDIPVDEGLGYWNGFLHDSDGEYGYAGVYVPNDEIVYPSEQADARMAQIAAALSLRDAAALRALFSPHAIDTAAHLDDRVDALLSMIPTGDVSWEREIVNTLSAVDDPERLNSKVVSPYYVLSAAGQDYWVWFADYVVNTTDSSRVGLAALAVTPWTEPGADDSDTAFDAFSMSWGRERDGEFGVYVPSTG